MGRGSGVTVAVIGAVSFAIAITAGACGDEGAPASPSSSSASSSGATSSGGSSSGSASSGSSGSASGSSGTPIDDAGTDAAGAADAADAADATDGAPATPTALLETFIVDGAPKAITTRICQQSGEDYEINGIHSTSPVLNVRVFFRRNGPPPLGTYVATASPGAGNAHVVHVDNGGSPNVYLTPVLGNPGGGVGTVTVVDHAGKLGVFFNDLVLYAGTTSTRTVSANYTCP